jgi:hypothetical protein
MCGVWNFIYWIFLDFFLSLFISEKKLTKILVVQFNIINRMWLHIIENELDLSIYSYNDLLEFFQDKNIIS